MILKQFNRSRKANFALFTLAMGGLVVSNFLLLAKLKGVHVGGCGTSGGCDAVNSSPYAIIGSIPVSAIGVLGYSLLAVLSFARMLTMNESVRKQLGNLTAVCVAIAAIFTTYLEYLMFFVILAICRWCMLSATITITMGITVLIDRFKQKESGSPSLPVHPLSTTAQQALHRWERNLFIMVALLGGLLVVAEKAYYDIRPPPPRPKPLKNFNPKELDPPGSHGMGPRDAKVLVVEFSNYECPHCQEAEPFLREIRKKYEGKIRFVVANRPLPQFPMGDYAAEVTEAVAAQSEDAYWKLHEKLLNSEILNEETIRKIVATLGIDTNRVWREMKEHRYKQRLERDRQLVKKFNEPATPTVFINRQPFFGIFKRGDLGKAIDQELAKATEPAPMPASSNKPPAKTDSR